MSLSDERGGEGDDVSTRLERTQKIIDAYYVKHGPCCAGCDWWRWYGALVGECTKTVPVAGEERVAMLGMTGVSMPVGAGHIMTLRSHVCGQFRDGERAAK